MTACNLYLRSPGEKRRPLGQRRAVVHLDEPGLSGYPIHHNLEQCFITPETPPEGAAAFLLAALGVWSADKLFLRRAVPDAWSREITLSIPADAPMTAQLPRLAPLLHFLTGDAWTLVTREAPLNLGFAARWPHAWRPQAVVLFSGGLDSLVGAIDLLEAGQRLLLVSHYDFGQLASIQQRLASGLQEHVGPDRLHHLGLRVQFPEAPELTLRSRSLLYLALGLSAAAAFGPKTTLLVPENGWISLNPPLTGSRLGPYSTRTTHPYFFEQLTAIWREISIVNPLVNPYQGIAKGEMLEKCRHQELLKQLAPLSLSCARPEVGRWQGKSGQACGYCYPCLIRRAALHRLGWDNGVDYRLDVLAEPQLLRQRVRGSDLRAVLFALKTWEEAPQTMMARLWLDGAGPALVEKLSQARRTLDAGFGEIAAFFRDKGGSQLSAYVE